MEKFFSEALEDFGNYLRLERGLSENTVSSYVSDVALFFDYLSSVEDGSAPERPEDCDRYCVSSYLAGRLDTLSSRSQARVLTSIRTFFSFMMEEGRCDENPCELIDTPKPQRKLPVVLSVEEVGRMISSVDLTDPLGHRNKAILEVMYGCGLRVSEAVSIRVTDIFAGEQFIRVIGKGDKQRLPVGHKVLHAGQTADTRLVQNGDEGYGCALSEPPGKAYDPCHGVQYSQGGCLACRHSQGHIPAYVEAFFRDSSYRKRGRPPCSAADAWP